MRPIGGMAEKIVVDALCKIFGDSPENALDLLQQGRGKSEIFAETGHTVGVHDASFAIDEGEIFVVMGLSGSGKSTLVRMFNRLIEPTSGSIRIDGEETTEMSQARLIELRRRDISMVFQSFALLPNRTVYENASFGLEVAGVAAEARRARTMEALESVGLDAYADSLPRALSGGMQQRVGLARALAADPTILLMDEAFSALDPIIRAEMQDQLLDLQKHHARTVVFVSHDLNEALKIGDRIAIMQEGNVVQVASPVDILRDPENDYVRAFFRGVDVSQVFTVGQIARRRPEMEIAGTDSPARAALDQLRGADHVLAVVLEADSRIAGMVTAHSLGAALEADAGALCRDALVPDAPTVGRDVLLSDVLQRLAESTEAIAVVEDGGRYVGLASKTDMLRALDRRHGADEAWDRPAG